MPLANTPVMSIISAYNEAWENGDVDALAEIIHDDFVFNPHVGGITMGKSDLLGFAGSDGGPRSENDRILFENDSVGVCLLYTSPSPRDLSTSRMPSSA